MADGRVESAAMQALKACHAVPAVQMQREFHHIEFNDNSTNWRGTMTTYQMAKGSHFDRCTGRPHGTGLVNGVGGVAKTLGDVVRSAAIGGQAHTGEAVHGQAPSNSLTYGGGLAGAIVKLFDDISMASTGTCRR